MFAGDRFHSDVADGVAGSISMRVSRVGGALLEKAEVDPPELFRRAERVVFLVHGFNVSALEADESYLAFERWLSASVRADVVRIYWPGDTALRSDTARERKGRVSEILSRISYGVKPPVAQQASTLLTIAIGKSLEGRPFTGKNALPVAVVAHSLGCRLALEAVRVFAANSMIDLQLVVLMAAAVPQYEVLHGGSYRITIQGLDRLVVMHSFADSVLGRWFAPGSLPDRPVQGWNPRRRGALGRKGMPYEPNIDVIEGDWDHSHYWSDKDVSRAVDGYLTRRGDRSGFHELARILSGRLLARRTLGGRSIGSFWN